MLLNLLSLSVLFLLLKLYQVHVVAPVVPVLVSATRILWLNLMNGEIPWMMVLISLLHTRVPLPLTSPVIKLEFRSWRLKLLKLKIWCPPRKKSPAKREVVEEMLWFFWDWRRDFRIVRRISCTTGDSGMIMVSGWRIFVVRSRIWRLSLGSWYRRILSMRGFFWFVMVQVPRGGGGTRFYTSVFFLCDVFDLLC